MTEWEKGQAGYLYDANYDRDVVQRRQACASLCHRYNLTDPADRTAQQQLLAEILGPLPPDVTVTPPFYCDYGCNISVGAGFYTNHNCTILDAASVRFGEHVFLGPNCVLTTAGHPTDPGQRAQGWEFARPITVGDDVWIGANVTVLPGVTIGRGSVIGAGSVVTRDVPPGVVAAGSPCRVLRPLTEADRTKYPVCP